MTTLVIAHNEQLVTEVRRSGEHALVMLDGELDLATASQLDEQLAELARGGIRHVAMNLAELDFLDCTGLSVFIAEHERVQSLGGELIIFSPCHQVRRLFEVTSLDGYFNVRPLKRPSISPPRTPGNSRRCASTRSTPDRPQQTSILTSGSRR